MVTWNNLVKKLKGLGYEFEVEHEFHSNRYEINIETDIFSTQVYKDGGVVNYRSKDFRGWFIKHVTKTGVGESGTSFDKFLKLMTEISNKEKSFEEIMNAEKIKDLKIKIQQNLVKIIEIEIDNVTNDYFLSSYDGRKKVSRDEYKVILQKKYDILKVERENLSKLKSS